MLKSNKGFSLVELIIVIAIMAILVGVMAPQLIKYIEKTKVSSDTQLCDAVREAIIFAMSDADVVTAKDGSQDAIAFIKTKSVMYPMSYVSTNVSGLNTTLFYKSVTDTLGFDPFVSNSGSQFIKSSPANTSGCLCFVTINETLYVYIVHSDKTGGKNDNMLAFDASAPFGLSGDVIIVPSID